RAARTSCYTCSRLRRPTTETCSPGNSWVRCRRTKGRNCRMKSARWLKNGARSDALKFARNLFVVLSVLVPTCAAFAQGTYPEKPVRILVGFTPGVAPDIAARLLADELAKVLAKPVVVENVTGAGGNIGAARVAQAAPDGYTLGMVGNGSLVFSPSMY